MMRFGLRMRVLLFQIAAACFCASAARAQSGRVSFTDIGVLPTENSSALVAVSADGSVAAGAVSSPEGAMIWTASGGIHLLDGIGTNTVAYGISGDGSTIVGGDFSNSASIQAIAWSRQGGRQSLGNFIASSASPDGKVIV